MGFLSSCLKAKTRCRHIQKDPAAVASRQVCLQDAGLVEARWLAAGNVQAQDREAAFTVTLSSELMNVRCYLRPGPSSEGGEGPCVKGATASRPYKEKQDDSKRVDT